MRSDLLHWIDDWRSLNVLVVGDIILDCFLSGHTDRICQEAPVPVVNITRRQDIPGGAANTAANVASLGATVSLLSVLGDDLEGDRLQRVLMQRNISTQYLIASPERATLAKQRVISGSNMLVRFDYGDTAAIASYLEDQLVNRLTELYPTCDAVLVSDYGYGIVTPRVIQALRELQAQHPRTLVVDSRQLSAYRQVGVTAVKPNYSETLRLLDVPKATNRIEQMSAYGDRLLDLTGAAIVAVTLDRDGAIIFERDQPPFRTSVRPAPDSHASGAGDTFVSTLTLALATGAMTQTAVELANAATTIVLQESGTTPCPVDALRRSLSGSPKLISSHLDLATCVQRHRAAGHQLVFTNGCFDILHAGHVTYLWQAKQQGDILFVGVNSDDSIRQLKGPERPVNKLSDRLAILAALDAVDYVVPFSELTPENLIRIICPDVFAKGGDYTRDTLPETELVEALGGTVRILPFVGDCSTTRLIHQILARHR
jgi:D-beta-D-heptose 7-phosphate kinase / D-beta-D-heptose 1-phosphate adenosyltransferase